MARWKTLRIMLDEAHAHGIKVIMDLVVNHCGSGNPWFQDAITNPETSPYRDYFKIEKSTDYDEDKDNNATDDAHSGNKRVWQQWRATRVTAIWACSAAECRT